MEDALLLVVSEGWRGPIMWGLFLILFVILCFFMNKAGKKSLPVRDAVAAFGSYFIFAILSCLYVLAIAFREVAFLLSAFPGSAIFGWTAIGVAVTYIVAFFRSVCRLATLQPGALQLTQKLLFSFPPFVAIFPFILFVICAWWVGGEYTFSGYREHMRPGITFFSGCLFSVLSLLYCALSSKVKKLAL